MTKILRIGIDFHGVINHNPEFFRAFTKVAFEKGHEIYIVSGGTYEEEKDYLDVWNIKYTHIFALIDYFKKIGKIEFFNDGIFRVSDELWDKAKADYCRINIDIHIDDTVRYRKNFTTPFCLYDKISKSCILGNRVINLSINPSDSLSHIENLFN
jgi:hypothetical protein